MVTNNSSALTKELIEAGKLQVTEGVPTQIGNVIQPVIDVNPKKLRNSQICKYGSVSTSGSGTTLYTTPATQDFFITAVCLSLSKDATCDASSGSARISAVIDGLATPIIGLAILTLTAENSSISYSLAQPIKVDRGTAIIFVSNTFTVGNFIRAGGVTGFVSENSNA